jgi:uncharacterized protein YggE
VTTATGRSSSSARRWCRISARERPPTVTVRGEGAAPGQPDEVVVSLGLSETRDRPELAYDEVAARSSTLEALFDELGIDAAARSTAGVSVDRHHEYGEHGRREELGYRASTRVLVRVTDTTLVSRLLREAVTRAQAHVEGPWWRIAADNAARTEARRRAALDARRRAETYAEALGGTLGRVIDVREPGTAPQAAGRFATFAAIDQPEIAVDPGELDVRALVDVTFALEES